MKKSIWLRNSEGKPDAVLTMTVMVLVVILIKLLFAEVSVEIGDHMVKLGTMDAGVVASLLTPTLGAYVMRKHTDAKYRDQTKPQSEQEEDSGK